ncbi:MAG: hypothetical protein KAR09_03970, partial [Bacteroidales bacterium]|nr:hypothetical protein [Bacteroidales bacterium]
MRYLLLIIIIFVMLSCQRDYENNGLRIFRYNEAAGITSLDPAFSRDLANLWACNQIFDGLVKLDDKLEVKPSVANSWEITEGGTTYTFFLRDDVYFHPHEAFAGGKGRRVSAYDFEYSYYRILDAGLASPGSWVFNNVADSGFKALNDST